MVQPVLKEKEPCYIFYRLDTYNVQQNYLWIFMSYTPDYAPVSNVLQQDEQFGFDQYYLNE